MIRFLAILVFLTLPKCSFAQFEFRFPVMIGKASDSEVQEIAKELSEAIGFKSKYQEFERNPGCAFWVRKDELSGISEPGYLIRVTRGGGIFEFTDMENARRGIRHLVSVSKKSESGFLELPLGMLTSFDVVKNPSVGLPEKNATGDRKR